MTHGCRNNERRVRDRRVKTNEYIWVSLRVIRVGKERETAVDDKLKEGKGEHRPLGDLRE